MLKQSDYLERPLPVGVVNVERWESFSELLARPDPPCLHGRGSRVVYGGREDRWHVWVPKLMVALRERLAQRRPFSEADGL